MQEESAGCSPEFGPQNPRRSPRKKRVSLIDRSQSQRPSPESTPDPSLSSDCEQCEVKLSDETTVMGRLEYNYRLFCSKRHLHHVVQHTGFVFTAVSLLSFTFLFSVTAALVSAAAAACCFAWYYFLRPKVVARVSEQFAKTGGKSRNAAKVPKAAKQIRAAAYVAETGFYLKSERPILGLYADQNVTRG